MGIPHVATGSVSTCYVDPEIVFATALKVRASSLILAHNHPSGDLQPSQGDIAMTETLQKAGRILDLPVRDHFILTPHDYYSFAAHRLCFSPE